MIKKYFNAQSNCVFYLFDCKCNEADQCPQYINVLSQIFFVQAFKNIQILISKVFIEELLIKILNYQQRHWRHMSLHFFIIGYKDSENTNILISKIQLCLVLQIINQFIFLTTLIRIFRIYYFKSIITTPTMNTKFDIVLIRHAQSLFNQASYRTADQLGFVNWDWTQLISNHQFNNLVSYNKQFIDPLLSQQGKMQCEKYRKQCEQIDPDVILVSPYRRTLETCHNLFKNTKAKVIVEPCLAQVFRYSCDVPQQLHHNKSLYPNFDFSKVQHLGDQWYLQNLQEDHRLHIKETLKKHNDHRSKQHSLVELLSKKIISENDKNMRERSRKIKNLLRKYRQKHQKVVVIAHYHVIQFLKSKGFDEDHGLLEYHNILNCHPYYQSLEQLSKVN